MTDPGKRTILCVDDEEDVLNVLARTFEDLYKVRTAMDGKEAMEIFLHEDISLVITDQVMPEMEGTELLAKINLIKPICKKILLTGFEDINIAIDAINSGGVDKYLTKPWDKKALLKIVGDLLSDLDTDEYIVDITGDARDFKEKIQAIKKSAERQSRFLDSFIAGICMVDADNRIEYVNNPGMKLMQCKDYSILKGKPVKDFFPLDNAGQELFYASYKKGDWSPRPLPMKMCNNQETTVQAYITFAGNKDQIVGIIFNTDPE